VVILLNGAFGVGKTTVARAMAKQLPRTMIFDPELIGFVLQRVRRVDDFQDLAMWRRLVVLGIRIMRIFRRHVIVPMAFSNLVYLEEIRSGIGRFEADVRHFCLVAPLQVVRERLTGRGHKDVDWQLRRASECCVAHGDAAFAEHIPTDGVTAEQVAERLLARVR
jgi:cytidylate kinase